MSAEKGALLSINNLPGGVGVYEFGDEIHATYLSRGLAKLLCYTPLQYHTYSDQNLLEAVHEQDLKRIRKFMRQATRLHRELDLEFRIKSEEEHWIRLLGRFARFHGQLPVYYVVASDVTENHRNRLMLEQQNARMQFAFSHSTLEMWEYHGKTDTVITLSRTILGGHLPITTTNPATYLKEHAFVHPSFEETIDEDFGLIREGIEPDSILSIHAADGTYRWMRISYTRISADQDDTASALGIIQDVDDEIQTRLNILGSDRAFFAAFNLQTGRPVLADSTVRKLMGTDNNFFSVYEKLFSMTIHPEYQEVFSEIASVEGLKRFIDSGNRELTLEAKMVHPLYLEKGFRWVRFHLSCTVSGPTVIGYIAIKDIDDTKKWEQALLERAHRDVLTGLLNRSTLEEKITLQLKMQKAGQLSAFLLIDIDHFKQINDMYGHENGDAVLKRISRLMISYFPVYTIIGRLGGDEFVVFLPSVTSQEQTQQQGNMFCRQVQMDQDASGIRCTCSIGICYRTEEQDTFEQLYQRSDIALYQAKEMGRNQCRSYEDSMGLSHLSCCINHEWILDNLDDTVFLTDLDTYELLFLNKVGRDRFAGDGTYLGKKCYEVLHKRNSACPYCKIQALSNDVCLNWVLQTDEGGSCLCKERLVVFNNKPAKLTVLVDQIKQAKEISCKPYAQDEDRLLDIGTYLKTLHYGGENWDYHVQLDLLTMQRIQEGRPVSEQYNGFMKHGQNICNIHRDDVFKLIDRIEKNLQTKTNESLVVRIENQGKYTPTLFTCYRVETTKGDVERIGGKMLSFSSYGFAERDSILPNILQELSVSLLVVACDKQAIFVFANNQCVDLLGLGLETLKEEPLSWLHEHGQKLLLSHVQALKRNQQHSGFLLLESKNGKSLELHIHLGPVYGLQQLATLTIQDISRQRQLQSWNKRMLSYVEQSLQGIALLKLQGEDLVLTYVNETFSRMLGYERRALTSEFASNAMGLFHPEDRSLLLREIEQRLLRTQQDPFRLRLLDREKHEIWCEISFRQEGATGRGQLFSLLFDDITQTMANQNQLMKTMTQLRFTLNHNLLTGLYTRQRFYEATRILLDENPSTCFVMVFFNVERISVMNELLGFDMGNQVLISIARSLESNFDGKGTYGNLEADHFALCIPKELCTVEKLHHAVDSKAISEQMGYAVSVVFGLYEIEDNSMQVSALVDRAHSAAKSTKYNYLQGYAVYHPSLRCDTFNEQEVLNQMHQALEENQFTFHLQPIYRLSDNALVSAEALVRWMHPTRGMVPPDQFIPVFERYGFITTMDVHLLKSVCAYQQKRMQAGNLCVPISMNLSRIDLSNRSIVDILEKTVASYRLDRSLIKFEVTESAYIDNPEQMCGVVQALQRKGFTILMDDFGTGYSSLNMLYSLPLDILKIDRSFVQALGSNNRSRHILETLVKLGKNLNMPVIAEGVETEEQKSCLLECGCEFVQGFLYERPLDIATFSKMLDSHG